MAELSARFINERFLPDKAIDVMDEVGSYFRLEGRQGSTVKVSDIEKVVSGIARIPAKSSSSSEIHELRELANHLKAVVFGQDEAIEAVTTAVKRSRAGLGNPDSPTGSFLFAGPTGVGKTEVARQLAATLNVHFERFDMSEYMEKHAVARLIGSPPAMSASTRAVCSPRRSASIPIRCCCSMRSKRPTPTSSPFSCR